MNNKQCILCSSDVRTFKMVDTKVYWDCPTCGLIFLDDKFLLNNQEEKKHYLAHNNDVNDIRYQKFVSPAVDYILQHFNTQSSGLDYGAGPGPVIASELTKKKYQVSLYDPYFWNNSSLLHKSYDFIVASEVIEHFYAPHAEFKKLFSLMNPISDLIIMTEIYSDNIDFSKWYYRIDPTHVVFYREQTFEWIMKYFEFQEIVKLHLRVRVLKKMAN
jgi:hypothetical protein